jgi:hypothetical protein
MRCTEYDKSPQSNLSGLGNMILDILCGFIGENIGYRFHMSTLVCEYSLTFKILKL